MFSKPVSTDHPAPIRLAALLLTLGLVLGACASTRDGAGETPSDTPPDELPATAPPPDTAPAPEPEAEPEPIEYGNFTREQLTQAIIGELGGLRGDMPGAAQTYYQLARETRDIGIIRRALQFAAVSGDSESAVEMARLWIEVSPNEVTPHLMLAYRFLDTGQPELAVRQLEKALSLGGEVDFTDISRRTQDLPASQREAIQREMSALHERYPQEQSLHFALIQLMAQNGQTSQALTELRLLRNETQDSVRLTLIESQLLQGMERSEEALTLLAVATERFPNSRILRMSYAQLLIQAQRLDEALSQFLTLSEQDPDDLESRFSLALLYMEMERRQEARAVFEQLLETGYRSNDAHFYLGYLFKAEAMPEAAIRHFSQVQMDSENFLNAQGQIILLLVNSGRYADAHNWTTELSRNNPRLEIVLRSVEAEALSGQGALDLAMDVLDGIIGKYPDNVDLLFNRTLLHERRGDLAAAEVDLKRIIALEPDNAQALNHLGYTLADRTDRHEEALVLIERAIALEPEDPAIIDSLGWVQFKLGRLEEAIANLRRAYADFPDPEVAAHLGEALWVKGETREARRIWEEALERRPDSDILREVMQRFRVSS